MRKSEWSEEICRKLEIDLDKLPKIVKATDIIGETTKDICDETGLPIGIPVCAGCGDVDAGFVGSNILRQGQAIDISGTANILSVNVGNFKYHRNFAAMKSPIDDSYYL